MKRLLFIVILILVANNIFAQYYETGIEPFSVKWRQISNGQIRLIYPSTAEKIASKYLNILTLTDSIVGSDYNIRKSKIDIVLHNHSSLSNGFVSWAPRRMEVITHPPFDGYAQPWNYQLAIHEMRHVKQMYALNHHAIKLTSYLFGQQAVGLAAGFIPLWFLEGDAVTAETEFSNTGRGRTAEFYQHYRAHYLSNSKPFSYDKWLLGSYKDFIPNHYSFGYQIVSYGNLKYGSSIWSNTIDYVTRKPFTIFPFYFGLKKQTGLSRKQLTEEMFTYKDSVWTAYLNSQSLTTSKNILKDSEEYSNYQYPHQINDSTIIVYKTTLTDIPSFTMINTKTQKETTITHPGMLIGKPYINDSLIIWSEYKPHLFWDYKDYSRIIKLNFLTKQQNIYSAKKMLGAPVYNSITNEISCIEYSETGEYKLTSLNGLDKLYYSLSFPDSFELFELAIDEKNGRLFVATVTNNGKEIYAIRPDSSLVRVLGPTYKDINSIEVNGNNIFFSSSTEQTEEIFLYKILDNKLFQITNSCSGSKYSNTQNNGSLLFSSYTSNGYKLSKIDSIDLTKEIVENNLQQNPLVINPSNKPYINIDTVKIPNISYKSKPYRGIGSLLNFHSWAPLYFNPYSISEESTVNPGVTILSQNLTGSTVLVLGYGYGKSHLFRANLRYYGLWPKFSLGYELLDTYSYLYRVGQNYYTPTSKRNKIKLYTFLPFTLCNNSLISYLQLFNSIERTNDYMFEESINRYRSGLFQMNNGIYFYAIRKLSHRDLLPKYGVSMTAMYVNAPYNKDNLGSLQAYNATLYLPGFLTNNHIKLSGYAQIQNLKNFYYSNKVDPPRGYSLYQSEKIYGMTIDYLFPLAYPDWAVGSLAYIKRFSVDFFFDYAKNSYPIFKNNQITTQTYHLQSIGLELNMDFHLLRTRYPFRLKFQQAFTGNNFSPYTKFSLTYDIYGNSGSVIKNVEL